MSSSQSVSDRRSVSAPAASPWTTTANARPARCLRIAPARELQRLGLLRFLAVGRRRVGIAAVRAHQPVDHELQHARRLVPIDRRHDHHAVGSDPARVELVHPVVDLAHGVVRVTGARPVAERHGRRDARLARQDLAAVLGREQAQIEEVALEAFAAFDDLTGEPGQPERLRHLAGAGLVVPRGAGDEQDAPRRGGILLPPLRALDRGPRSPATRSAARTRDRRNPGRPSASAGSCGIRRRTSRRPR